MVDDLTDDESSSSIEEYPLITPLTQSERLPQTKSFGPIIINTWVTPPLDITSPPEGNTQSKEGGNSVFKKGKKEVNLVMIKGPQQIVP